MALSESSSGPETKPSSPVPTQRRKGCGCWTILLTLFLVFVVAPVVALTGTYLTLLVSDHYWLEQETGIAREKGYPLTLEELEAEYPTSPEIEAATTHWQKAIEIVDSEAYEQATIGVPIVDRSDAAKKVEPVLPLAGDDLASSQAFVARYAEVLEEAHAARRSGTTARFPVDFEGQPLGEVEHGLPLRAIADLLRLEMETRLVEGDASGAVDDVLSMIGAGESLANEPLLFSHIVRCSILRDAVDATEELLSRRDLDDADLVRLQQGLAAPDFSDVARRAIDGERVIALRTIQGQTEGSPAVEEARWFSRSGASSAKSLEMFRRYREANDRGMLAALEGQDAIPTEIDEYFGDVLGSLPASLAILTLPSLSVAISAAAHSDADLELAETAVACERYRTANGFWPENLERLVPDYMDEVSVDPYDGRPLRYRVDGDGVSLYSVGRNQIDQDGLDDAWDGDLVFRIDVRDQGLPVP